MMPKISPEKIREIRSLRLEMVPNKGGFRGKPRKDRPMVHKYGLKQLGQMCGVSAAAAWFAIHGHTYKWVSP